MLQLSSRLIIPSKILTFTTVTLQIPVSGAAKTAFIVLRKTMKTSTHWHETPLVGQLHVPILTAAAMFAVDLNTVLQEAPWTHQEEEPGTPVLPLSPVPHLQLHYCGLTLQAGKGEDKEINISLCSLTAHVALQERESFPKTLIKCSWKIKITDQFWYRVAYLLILLICLIFDSQHRLTVYLCQCSYWQNLGKIDNS